MYFKKIFHKTFQNIKTCYIFAPELHTGSVVQLVRMPPCHGGGRGFESRPDRKKALKQHCLSAFCILRHIIASAF